MVCLQLVYISHCQRRKKGNIEEKSILYLGGLESEIFLTGWGATFLPSDDQIHFIFVGNLRDETD
jgi:hypothetical protein